MKRIKRRLRKASGFSKFLYLFLIVLYIVSFLFFAAHIISLAGIETIIRYIILILGVLYLFYYIKVGLRKLVKKKYPSYYLLSFITIIIISVYLVTSTAMNFFLSVIGNIKEQKYITYSSNLIVLKDHKLTKNSVIGMIDDKEDIEGYILANKIIKENKLKQTIKKYDDYFNMLYALYDKKVDGIFVSGNYKTIYGSEEDFASIDDDTKVIYAKKERRLNKSVKNTSTKKLTDPFTILAMGVDSEFDGLDTNSAFNGDTLIVATFNPKTYNVTLLSIPRDTVIKIACRNKTFKINSSAAYGNQCVIDTVESLIGIKIDYYVKINFKGVVDLVEALGGIEVDVEPPTANFYCGNKICEQDSLRRWGEHTIYMDTGLQNLNGEQALAYARCRHLYASSDLARNKHQQDVIVAIAQKAIKARKINDLKKIINAISNNISTNMSTNQILSGYDAAKDIILNIVKENDFIDIERAYLETYPLAIIGTTDSKKRSALGYYKDSIEEITKEMKINLNLENKNLIKTFSFDINEVYEPRVIGKGKRKIPSYQSLNNFVGKSKNSAEDYCDNNNLSCEFTYIDENSQYYKEDYEEDIISYQSPLAYTLLDDIKKVNFYVIGKKDDKKSGT